MNHKLYRLKRFKFELRTPRIVCPEILISLSCVSRSWVTSLNNQLIFAQAEANVSLIYFIARLYSGNYAIFSACQV